MDTPTTTLAAIVQHLRNHVVTTGISKVAEATSISKATLHNVAHGNGLPTVQNVDRLAAHFGYGFKLHSTDRRKRHATAVTQKGKKRSRKPRQYRHSTVL